MKLILHTAPAALLLAACSAPSASVSPMIANLGLDGSFGAASSGAIVSSDFGELGIDSNEAALGLKAQVSFLGAQLSLSGFDTEFEGSGTTEGEISIGGQTISANTAVDTQLDLMVARALLTWNLIPVGPVEFGIGLGASLIDFDLRMREELSGDVLETDEFIPIPVLAVRAAWVWGPVKVRTELGGMKVKIDDDEGQIIDGDVEASVSLFDGGSLLVGYRLLDIDAEYEEEDGDRADADFELSGFYLGVRFAF
jgi:hypothetical protein